LGCRSSPGREIGRVEPGIAEDAAVLRLDVETGVTDKLNLQPYPSSEPEPLAAGAVPSERSSTSTFSVVLPRLRGNASGSDYNDWAHKLVRSGLVMVECFDRIHLQLTEVVLKPLRALQTQPPLSVATVRLPGRGCRVELTVTKNAPPEPSQLPSYTWAARMIDDADPRSWGGENHLNSPESAYWDAVDVIGASLRRRSSV
jgi:hypothetical protein